MIVFLGLASVSGGEYFSLVKEVDASHTSLLDLRQSVDTALLKCYVITNDPAASNLLMLEDNRHGGYALQNKWRSNEYVNWNMLSKKQYAS